MSPSASKVKLKKNVGPSGRAEYIGLSLPVDISMIFQVTEGEDPRCAMPEAVKKQQEKDHSGYATGKSVRYARSVSQVDAVDALENHMLDNCLGCFRLKRNGNVFVANVAEDDDDTFLFVKPAVRRPSAESHRTETSRGTSPITVLGISRPGPRSNNESYADIISALPGSVASSISIESNLPKSVMSEEGEAGRNLIRKEVMRLIINLSSSVGVKGTEKALLSLKQKFPKTFQDICLYSEVCYTLAHYNYRLAARRFIQELFQDVNFYRTLEEAALLLGLNEEAGPSEADIKLEKVLESMT